MTIAEACNQGIARVRLPHWAVPNAYLKLDLLPNNMHGPWGHLYERSTQAAIGAPTPQDIFIAGDPEDRFVAYEGELDPADKEEVVA